MNEPTCHAGLSQAADVVVATTRVGNWFGVTPTVNSSCSRAIRSLQRGEPSNPRVGIAESALQRGARELEQLERVPGALPKRWMKVTAPVRSLDG